MKEINREELYMKIIRQLIQSNWKHTEYGPTINFDVWKIILTDFHSETPLRQITDRFLAEIFDKMDEESPHSEILIY